MPAPPDPSEFTKEGHVEGSPAFEASFGGGGRSKNLPGAEIAGGALEGMDEMEGGRSLPPFRQVPQGRGAIGEFVAELDEKLTRQGPVAGDPPQQSLFIINLSGYRLLRHRLPRGAQVKRS